MVKSKKFRIEKEGPGGYRLHRVSYFGNLLTVDISGYGGGLGQRSGHDLEWFQQRDEQTWDTTMWRVPSAAMIYSICRGMYESRNGKERDIVKQLKNRIMNQMGIGGVLTSTVLAHNPLLQQEQLTHFYGYDDASHQVPFDGLDWRVMSDDNVPSILGAESLDEVNAVMKWMQELKKGDCDYRDAREGNDPNIYGFVGRINWNPDKKIMCFLGGRDSISLCFDGIQQAHRDSFYVREHTVE